jgi:protein-S-isoprenylcysteine O-methyltransferase Ste14
MTRSEWVRASALYFPLALALLAGMLRRRERRLFAACLLSVLWAVCSLLVLQRLNARAIWWTFAGDGPTFREMPLELYLGWVILWGILPQIAFRRLPLAWIATLMVAADIVFMPLCTPVVLLARTWLFGEAAAAVLVLLPSLLIARWTLDDTHLRLRAAMQVAIASLLLLYWLPEVIFALRVSSGWTPLLETSGWRLQIELQIVFLLALPGVNAVMEFAIRGSGTPIPYDPPKRLVVSGIYRYCANPMQLSSTLVMIAWAVMLHNGWLLLAAAVSLVYSAGIAEWDESHDLAQRFGAEWKQYRAQVRNWFPRWRPYHAGASARLYIASTCGPCSELREWIEARCPLGLEIVDAETLPSGSIRRMRYEPGDGGPNVEGVRAMGRTLEHLHLGWAIAGIALRLPGIWQVVQLVMDASGLGPRTLSNVSAPRSRV